MFLKLDCSEESEDDFSKYSLLGLYLRNSIRVGLGWEPASVFLTNIPGDPSVSVSQTYMVK